MGQGDGRGDNGTVSSIFQHVADKAAIYLDFIDRKGIQVRQGGVACAEVIYCTADIGFMKIFNDLLGMTLNDSRFGYFQAKCLFMFSKFSLLDKLDQRGTFHKSLEEILTIRQKTLSYSRHRSAACIASSLTQVLTVVM